MSKDSSAQDGNPQVSARSKRRALADLLPRVLSSFVLMAAAVVSVWLGGRGFDFIWFCAALAVAFEWQYLIAAPRLRVRLLCTALGLGAGAYLVSMGSVGSALAVLAVSGLALAVAGGSGRRIWACAGIAYAGSLILSLGALHGSAEHGARSVVWLFANVWGTDVFAYFGGRLIGGPKLWPRISPSKTWSGTLTGIIAGAALGTAAGAYGLGPKAQLMPIFALGLAAAAISQAGDIFESSVKRHFGAKDSSGLIPGHGGFMDRLDGFIAAAAFAALFALARGGPSAASGLFDWS
jgi:phosphatidate cytidylyltransferase